MACELPVFDICIQEGADFKIVFSLLDDNGDAVDLSGGSAEMQLKVVGVVTPYAGVINGNSITYNIPNTVVFDGRKGTYQAEYTLTGEIVRFLRGDVEIERNY